MIKDILNDEVYIEAIKNLDISYMPIHWKAFFGNAKKKFVVAIYILLIMMNFMASKK